MPRNLLPDAEPPDNTGEGRRLYAEFDANTGYRVRVYQSLHAFPPMVWVCREEGEAQRPSHDQIRLTLRQTKVLRDALTQFLDESAALGWDLDGIWCEERMSGRH